MMRNFDRDTTIQLFVIRQVDQTEPPFAQDPFNPVATDPLDKRLNRLFDWGLICGKDDGFDFGIGVGVGFCNAVRPLLTRSKQVFDLYSESRIGTAGMR